MKSIQSIYMEDRDGISVLNVEGRIDASNSGQIHERIMDEIERGCYKIVVNFAGVSYISSAGLRVLIYASKAVAKNSGAFSICSVNDNIDKIFQVSGLACLFDIQKDVAASIEAMRS